MMQALQIEHMRTMDAILLHVNSESMEAVEGSLVRKTQEEKNEIMKSHRKMLVEQTRQTCRSVKTGNDLRMAALLQFVKENQKAELELVREALEQEELRKE